jgi:hypothetical protein
MGTASNDTLAVNCTGFKFGKLTGKLMLNTTQAGCNGTFDKLIWSNGNGWFRVSKPPVVA